MPRSDADITRADATDEARRVDNFHLSARCNYRLQYHTIATTRDVGHQCPCPGLCQAKVATWYAKHAQNLKRIHSKESVAHDLGQLLVVSILKTDIPKAKVSWPAWQAMQGNGAADYC